MFYEWEVTKSQAKDRRGCIVLLPECSGLSVYIYKYVGLSKISKEVMGSSELLPAIKKTKNTKGKRSQAVIDAQPETLTGLCYCAAAFPQLLLCLVPVHGYSQVPEEIFWGVSERQVIP